MSCKIKGAIKIETSPRYSENESKCGPDTPCIKCGKGIKDALTNPKQKFLRAGPGGIDYAIPADAPDQGGGEMGCWPIGEDCLKRQPELRALTFTYGPQPKEEEKPKKERKLQKINIRKKA